jgi:signal transduction histidine kinase/ABC-type amino acid transport substrate-binding protein
MVAVLRKFFQGEIMISWKGLLLGCILFCSVLSLFFWTTSAISQQTAEPFSAQIQSPGNIQNIQGAFTEEEQRWLAKNHTVRVRLGKAPPYSFFKEEPLGISGDYLNAVAQRAGFQVKYFPDIPWSDALKHIENREKIDLLPALTKTPDRKEYLAFTQNYLTSPRVIFTRENSGFVDSLEDLSNKTISVERGYFLQQKLSDEYPNIKLLIKETTEDALESLSMGEADAYVGNLMAGTYIIKMKGLNNIKVAAPAPFGNLTLAMGVRKDWPELASIINKVLSTFNHKDHVAIRDKWVAPIRYEYGMPRWVKLTITFGTGLLLIIFFLSIALKHQVKLKTSELMGKAIALEEEMSERKLAEEALRKSEKELSIRNRIVEIFIKTPDDKMYYEVLQIVLEVMESPYGTFAYINENGDRVVPVLTRDIWVDCEVQDIDIVFPREKWTGIWGQCLVNEETVISNGPFRVPEGHVSITRAMAVPIIHQGEVTGNLMISNKSTSYGKKDKELLESIADKLAPILHARLQVDRQEGKRKQAEEALKEHSERLEEMVEERTKDLKDAQEQLVRSEKLAALGKLAGTLGHEIKAPLSVIKHSFEFLKIRLDQGADVKVGKHLNIVHKKLDTIDKTIDDVLDFARTKKLQSIDIDPEKLVEDTLRDISVPASIKIVRDLGSGLPRITVDEIQIQQAFHNIISNAIDAMDEGGTLTVSTHKQISDNAGHEFVTISFEDTGEGISPDHIEKVFEPLFSTKVKGAGLGLVACENVIHAHGGNIEVSSEVGKGSTFIVKFPIKEI